MKNPIRLIVILLCLAGVVVLAGFYIATTNTANVFIGIAVMTVGELLALSALIPVRKLLQQQRKQKEERIRKLEEKVDMLEDMLKKNNLR